MINKNNNNKNNKRHNNISRNNIIINISRITNTKRYIYNNSIRRINSNSSNSNGRPGGVEVRGNRWSEAGRAKTVTDRPAVVLRVTAQRGAKQTRSRRICCRGMPTATFHQRMALAKPSYIPSATSLPLRAEKTMPPGQTE